MLALKSNGVWTRWVGQLLGDNQYGANIETAWSDDELMTLGLHRVSDPGVPQGKVAKSSSLADVNGVPTVVYVLEDAPPAPVPILLPYQFFAMLEISGMKSSLDAFINSIPAPGNIVARAKLDRSLEFRRDNDLVLAAQQALGLTDQQLDALWTQAAAL